LNNNLKIIGIIATLFDQRINDHKEILKQLRENSQCEILGVIKKAAAAQKGLNAGLPAVVNEPNHEITTEYVNIANKIIEIIERGTM